MNRIRSAIILLSVIIGMTMFATPVTFHVTVSDENNQPVSNVNVVVSTLSRLGFNAGKNPSDYARYSAVTDEDGVAEVVFPCIDEDFRWWVETPNYYTPPLVTEKLHAVHNKPSAADKTEIASEKALLKAETGGSWLRVFELAESFTIMQTTVTNTAVLLKKGNPKRLEVNRGISIRLPILEKSNLPDGSITGVVSRVGIDLLHNDMLEPYGEFGTEADFWLTRSCSGVASNMTCVMRLIFSEGCGVYRAPYGSNTLFRTCFAADTNETFMTSLECSYQLVDGVVTNKTQFHRDDEYLVMHTRVERTEDGSLTPGHFVVVQGLRCGRKWLSSGEIIFNPTPGDTILEPVK